MTRSPIPPERAEPAKLKVAADAKPVVAIVRFHPHDVVDAWREATTLRDAGYQVEMLCLNEGGQPKRETIDGIHIRRVSVNKSRGGPIAYAAQYAHWFLACLGILTVSSLRTRYHAIQVSTLPDPQVFATIVPKLRGARIILSLKEPAAELFGQLIGGRTEPLIRATTRASIKYADRCVAVTTKHRDNYVDRGASVEKFSVVSNSTPSEWLIEGVAPAVSPSAFVVVCHGTIEERWGYEIMIRAVAIAARDLPNLRLVLPGKGNYRAEAESLAAELGVAHRVQFPGWISVDELTGWLHRADVGLAAQLSSPYSNLVHTGKMYDFFLADVPVVASRLAATEADFATACAFYGASSPDELAAELVRLAGDPAARAALVSAGRDALTTHGWPSQITTYLNLFA